MKKYYALLLSVLMLTGTMLSAASCSNASEIPSIDTKPTTDADAVSDTSATETERDIPPCSLPDDLDYNGDEIVIISRNQAGWTTGEISVEKINGDPINDAVYERNIAVENRLNVKIKHIYDDDTGPRAPVTKVLLTVAAGIHEYDVMASPCYGTMNSTLENNYIDLGDLEYLDLDQPWWCQGFNEVIEYQGSRYAVTGHGVLSQYRFAYATVFNHNLFEDSQVEFPYDEVRKGTWTLDRQIELVQMFHRDNGDGVADTDGDIYGLLTAEGMGVDPYWSACQVHVVEKNIEGEYEVVFNLGKLADVTDKILRLFHGSDQATYVYPADGEGTGKDGVKGYFAQGNAAMATVCVMALETADFRNMKDTFGVLPMPKYDTLQENYYTHMFDQFTIFTIPATISAERAEQVGAFLEAFNYEGYRLVQPAYYEVALRTKLVQNPDSAEMMNIIVNGIDLEFGIIYGEAVSQTFHIDLRNMIMSKNNTVSSTFKGLASKFEKRTLPNITEKIEKMQNNK